MPKVQSISPRLISTSVIYAWLIQLCLPSSSTALAQTMVVTIVSGTNAVAVAAPSTSAVSYTSDDTFKDAMLNSTNVFRSQSNASALSWNDSLASTATDWANGCVFAHSGGPDGENIAEGYPNATATVEAWGNERKQYDFAAGNFNENTGHFTQLVWKNTSTMGCGRASCNGKNNVPGWLVVCEYSPRGNVVGQFLANVQAPPSGVISAASTLRLTSTLQAMPTATSSSLGTALHLMWTVLGLPGVWMTIAVAWAVAG